MILHNQFQQGSEDWLAARLGIPTASEFHRILTPTGKPSAQARGYAIRLATERLLNRSLDSIDNLEWVQRGKELEPVAVKAYEFEHDATTAPIGFVTTDDGRIGASPDRLVGDVGLLEIKCPAPQTHLAYLIDGPGTDYRTQVQGQMMVCEREWADFFSYSPEMPPVRIRFERDEPFIDKLRAALAEFNVMLAAILETAKGAGLFVERRKLLTPETDLARAQGDALPAWMLLGA